MCTPRVAIVVLVLASLVVTAHAQNQGQSGIEGVWKIADVEVVGGSTPSHNSSPQPGYYIFTRGYYSIMSVGGDKKRPAISLGVGQKATDADKLARYEHWAEFTANSGTYTVKGNVLTTRPLVAKNQAVMEGEPQTREFKVDGKTLVLVQKQASGETRTKLTRME